MRIASFVLFLLALGLAACGAQTSVVKLAPLALTFTPSSTLTFPTLTPSPSPTQQLTLTATAVALSQSEILKAIKANDFEKLCGGFFFSPTMDQSPDNQWIAVPCNQYTKIIKTDGTQTWTVSFKELSLPDIQGLDNFYLSVKKWSIDEKNAYLALSSCCADRRGGLSFSEHALYHLDLASGKFTTILNASTGYYAFGLSTNEHYLAYSKQNVNNKIFIKDLALETEAEIALNRNYMAIGQFVWNADGSTVAFGGEVEGWLNGSNGFSVFSLNPKNMLVLVLIDNDTRLLLPIKWLDLNQLLLHSDEESTKNKYWKFNILTKSIISAPAP